LDGSAVSNEGHTQSSSLRGGVISVSAEMEL
jgi:hypothetical protein